MGTGKKRTDFQQLGRRERQILDTLYQLGEASAEEVRRRLPEGPSNATVRKWLSLMEGKELVTHRRDGKRFIYRPVTPRRSARRMALNHLVKTFFQGSRVRTVAALLSEEQGDLSDEERKLFAEMIGQLGESKKKR